jgi:hypothetical protein
MADHRFNVLAATAALSLALASEAAAGGCCLLVAPVVPEEMYLVNQGPVFSGPGHNLPRQFPDPAPAPGGYPYVGFVYSGYPYGLQDSGGYPRGAYSPYTGYPYAEPPPRGYRAHYRSVRSYPRYPR